ncbi:hypothetical protein THRCLA_00503 [Thraustotheca clavata]|uniref:Vacuolar membrane protease n=1 Tax=Thraustotheca clavata TaxID=74557 RepID=A0A1W0AB48_9STRA|nr:hypothetical protein THRCLA_00503 [Thraustotheca clavata]
MAAIKQAATRVQTAPTQYVASWLGTRVAFLNKFEHLLFCGGNHLHMQHVPSSVLVLAAAFVVFINVVLRSRMPPVVDTFAMSKFSGERAYSTLHDIATTKHPAPTQANFAVYNYLFDHLEFLQRRPNGDRLVLDSKRASINTSSFPLNLTERLPCSNMSAYLDQTQIIARLPGRSNSSVLLTAHFDSVMKSFGASDDGAGVAISLEVLRILLNDAAMEHSLIVFLDNGEESGLCGSKWFVEKNLIEKYNIQTFVNLEGGGTGGRAILFRSTDDALSSLYVSVAPHPHMNSIGGSIISLLGSYTDYQTYKPAGIPGVDIAFYEHRENYHTSNDNLEHITASNVQYAGDDVLAFTRSLLNHANLKEFTSDEASLYFDFLGDFGIVLTLPMRSLFVLSSWIAAGLVLLLSYYCFPLYDTMIVLSPKAFVWSILGEWIYIVRSLFQCLLYGIAFNLPLVIIVFLIRTSSISWLALPNGFLGNIIGATAAAHRWRHGQPHPNVNSYVHFGVSVASCSSIFSLFSLVNAPIFILFSTSSTIYCLVLLSLMFGIMYSRFMHDPSEESSYIPTRTAPMYYSTIKPKTPVLSPRAPQIKVYVGLSLVVLMYMSSAVHLSIDLILALISVGSTNFIMLAVTPVLLTPAIYPIVSLCAYWEPNVPSYRNYYFFYISIWFIAAIFAV